MEEASMWSEELKQLTRTSFHEQSIDCGPEGYAMKNWDDRYGVIALRDWLAGRIIIHVREDSAQECFETIDAAIAAGWVID